jgi:hypothetical protein
MIETVVTLVALLVAIAQWLFGDQVALRGLRFKKVEKVEQYPFKVLVLGSILSQPNDSLRLCRRPKNPRHGGTTEHKASGGIPNPVRPTF